MFRAAISLAMIRFVCFSYVDDTDLIVTDDDNNTPGIQLLPQAQRSIDHWNGGLNATGGALNADKGYWWLIDWVREKGNWRIRTSDDKLFSPLYRNELEATKLAYGYRWSKDDLSSVFKDCDSILLAIR